MVISRATSSCQPRDASLIRIAAPAVSEARKVMMATTVTSARPAMDASGTSAISLFMPRLRPSLMVPREFNCRPFPAAACSSPASIVNMEAAIAQNQPAGAVELIHQAEIVRRDHHGRPGFVEFGEQTQHPARETWIDIAGRLVGEQKFRPHDERAGNGGALLFAAGEHRRQNVHSLAKTDPMQKFRHFGAIARFLLAAHAERKSDVFIGRQMVEQPEILKYHADPPSETGDRGFVES